MIYVMSDIHGLYDRYLRMLDLISLKEDDTLYVLGDVIDRGPDGIAVLLDLMERKNAELFLGNHEHMMLMWMDGYDRVSWLMQENGGDETLRALRALPKDVQKRILYYLREQTHLVKHLKYPDHQLILSHTGVWLEGTDLDTKDVVYPSMLEYVWNMGRYSLYQLPALKKTEYPTTLISGHIITRYMTMSDKDEIVQRDYWNGYSYIDIDCGCAMGIYRGKLACLKINDAGKIEDVLYTE